MQSGAAKWAFGYTSLELSGGFVAGDTHLRIINILMLFSRGTGRIHLEKEYRQKRDLKMWPQGFQYLEVTKKRVIEKTSLGRSSWGHITIRKVKSLGQIIIFFIFCHLF